ncbi:30S ribosomal protein S4 [Ureaplasma miroungigenitalium]|uniref:30S ribosomal protein S4 n=1 Tax=Ureaplasma miroungigenitalium TaxID=1042321 RepID=UPI0021E887F3|nr:30S ribosomal protein S4 [Ureaplasma miroungigenitalium]MCV3733994.1 30S ribosomal protein S4 [Ureaplasma miroungigenitalium]
MSRYTGSIYRKSRHLGFSLLENNKEFNTGKKRTYGPGQHGNKKVKLSNYGQQLLEKQKLMYLYGLNDRQFRRLYKVAMKKGGVLTLDLLQVLESRLDSVVFRAGLAPTRRAARQLVNHNHVLVNDKKNNIPSALLSVGDVISLKASAFDIPIIKNTQNKASPFIDTIDAEKKVFKLARLPEREELPADVNEAYVVEWYNRLM